MSFDARKNFAISTVATAPSPATSGPSLVVNAGDGAKFATPPYNAVVWPAGVNPNSGNAEVVRVTAISTDTFTITRTQEGSAARTIVAGDNIMAGLTDKALKDIENMFPVTEANLSISDNTTANASTTAHGFVPKGPNNTDHAFLRDDVTWVTPRLIGEVIPYAGRTAPNGWLLCYGQAISRSAYANLFSAITPNLGNPTVTIASPAVFTLNGHGLNNGDPVYLTTTGALPTGLSANTIYYVYSVTTNTFELTASRLNAGTVINTSGSQSGTHSIFFCPYGLGDGSTTFNVPDLRGRVAAGVDMMGGTAANNLAPNSGSGTYGNQGASGGEPGHTLSTAEMPVHNHGITDPGHVHGTGPRGSSGSYGMLDSGSASSSGYYNVNAATTGITINNAGSGGSHNNIQPTLVLNYLIKT